VAAAVLLSARKKSKPLILRWSEPDNPLPQRRLRSPARLYTPPLGANAPPWIATGDVQAPFDFCGSVRRLCSDIARRCPELAHVDDRRILIGVTQARNACSHGLQARVTPLRFHDGRMTRERNGIVYQVQRYFLNAEEFLYLLTFCLPRFLNQTFDDKFITIFHELYHISPLFNGDLRRHHGRYALHTHSQKCYDGHMSRLARDYLSSRPDSNLHSFLRLDFNQLAHRHGGVVGACVPRPKIVPLPGHLRETASELSPSAQQPSAG
jgi:hypothetical protein